MSAADGIVKVKFLLTIFLIIIIIILTYIPNFIFWQAFSRCLDFSQLNALLTGQAARLSADYG